MADSTLADKTARSNGQYRATAPSLADGDFAPLQMDADGALKVSPKALDDTNDSITTYDKCSYVNLSASALVKTGAGQVYGVIIASHSSGTLKLWDNTSAATTVLVNTMTFAAGERAIFIPGANFGTGLYATIGGTADITILYR